MKVEKIEMYRTSDGMTFATEEEAQKHENLSLFSKIYDTKEVCLTDKYSSLSPLEVYDWLIKHSEFVIDTLKQAGKL